VTYTSVGSPLNTSTGTRSFCSDQTGVIYYLPGTACTASIGDCQTALFFSKGFSIKPCSERVGNGPLFFVLLTRSVTTITPKSVVFGVWHSSSANW
jgi:hypothetical protein